jgi:asparagine synthase (glutamine-hydrolysing)
MISDVPVGAFLSGGLDSNAIVALMQRHTSEKIRTFTIGFNSGLQATSEAELARKAAAHYGTDHHEAFLNPKDVADLLPQFFAAMDSPTGDGLNTFLVAHAARVIDPALKVILSGAGGDELFLGYRKYRWLAQHEEFVSAIQLLPISVRLRLAGTLRKRSVSRVATAVTTILDIDRIRTLFSPREIASLTGTPYMHSVRNPDAAPQTLLGVLRSDLEGYLPDMLLHDIDAMTMSQSLEARAPLLDKDLVEFAWQLPLALKAQGTSKQILSDAVQDIVPEWIRSRPKTGFELPMREWLLQGELTPLLNTLRDGDLQLIRDGLLQRRAVQTVYRQFVRGRSHYLRPWSILALEGWYKAFPRTGEEA